MSAPKPKVRCTGSWSHDGERMFDYTWHCDCGQHFDGGEDWHDMIHDAVKHSRTHTAERIADRLEEWAGKRTDSSAGGAYWEGYLEGAALAQREAALLVRRYLVGGAS